MDLSNSQLDLGLDLAYDIEGQEDSNSLNRKEVYKLKFTKRCELIIFCIFIIQSANVLLLLTFIYWDFISKLSSKNRI